MIRAILYVTDDTNQSGRAKLTELEDRAGNGLVALLRQTADAIESSKVEADIAQITVKVESDEEPSAVDLKAQIAAHRKSKK